MAQIHQFRSQLNGFNRQDVVNYIELMNNQHNAQIQQLQNQLQLAEQNQADPELQAQLDAALARCEELEAQSRAHQIYQQATAALADATAKAEVTAQRIGAIADDAVAQLKVCQAAVLETKSDFDEAVAALYAVKPEE